MGRPRKADAGDVPTKERLFNRALELFAVKGFESVSVREITASLGLNEATLYIHFKNKAALVEEIFNRFESKVISSGFKRPPSNLYNGHSSIDIAATFIEGARHFFMQADREVLLIWRTLMISQYRHEPARQVIEKHVLATPVWFFTEMCMNMQKAQIISQTHDCRNLGRIIASIFFDYSFRSNLKAAWNEDTEPDFEILAEEIRSFAGLISRPSTQSRRDSLHQQF